ncbi:hypothetical protein B0T22DRAFT_290854 [Podospora appendiculata]|uniref:AAA+ ATPase domain-containing protein n=1 Tax=Podospora appendiculata TaxID=314037 RepID=A0AAE0X1C7_9PEZI|nr:hypothetical protein B0T22DRAFT_290854 [Podospora appendiculata]
MAPKRKRDILEGFDPNKSDPEDENFDPTEPPARRSSKKPRASRAKGGSASGSRKRNNRYGGSDIEDDEDISDSDREDYSGGDNDDEEEEEDANAPLNLTGRRMRQAAVKHQSYKESTDDDDDVIGDSGEEEPVGPKKSTNSRPSRIVVLKQPQKTQRPKRGEAAKPPPVRRATRAHTEEMDEPLVELSASGKHALPAGTSKSRTGSPEAIGRPTRATRGLKGVKKPPATIEEATQETDPKVEPEAQHESEDELAASGEELQPEQAGDLENQEAGAPADENMEDQPTEVADPAAEDGDVDEGSDEAPVTRRTRGQRAPAAAPSADAEADEAEPENEAENRRPVRQSRLRSKKSLQEPSSDFEPGDESAEGEVSASEQPKKKGGRKSTSRTSSSSPTPTPARGRSARSQGRAAKKTRSQQDSGDEEVELDKDEMAEELEELRESSRSRPRRTRRRSPSIQYEEPVTKKRRTTKPVNYSIPAIDFAALEVDEEEEQPAATPAKGRKGGKNGSSQNWERALHTAFGPFGGGGGPGAVFGGPWGTGATGGVDSDSSDDEMGHRSGVGGGVGMTPTSAAAPTGLLGPAGPHGADGFGVPNVGKVKNQKAYADADPLGVDLSVDFSKVGGLQGHIDQLKEMVQLPLLYPELFLKFHVTPPRGVLFHGPPGTGKTLLARALANSVGSGGRKISFYMRKGADALSKWVGEAEKQLRLLFEEARRTQPSIIFFDEIDGLAPVRSSKQEQIHASIVSTLLALMDGMDGRGQVIVIGATNRPDNIDPALRRPGRFDREFYFPLPDAEARRSIIDIHTQDWGISDAFKNNLAENTKGYGGADLRALCTEAALNAIQRTYPQIYSSREKLVVNPDEITIHATDFMLSVKKMIPSSERSASSAATPLPRSIEPLLRNQYNAILRVLDNILPRPKKTTALQEAMYEQYQDADHGFGREAMHQEFERSRIFRPRLLICGVPGMGQNYLAAAVLHHLEGVHVQNFDLATLLGDGRPIEQVIVSLFTEVRRHKPSVIYIPNVDVWWTSIGDSAITAFTTMLRNIPPADPVLLLGTSETVPEYITPEILKELFGFSKRNRAVVDRPERELRLEFFESIIFHLRQSPSDFPDPANRKKRVLKELELAPAPPPPPKVLTKEAIQAQRKADLHSLNLLKMRLQPIMEQIKQKYKKFRVPIITFDKVQYLFKEADKNFVRPDVDAGVVRPYELATDKEGTGGILEVGTGKFYYNLEIVTIEERLANGYYARPVDFYNDIHKLCLDARTFGDRDRMLKANELLTNVEVDTYDIAQNLAAQGVNCEEVHQRQLQRYRLAEERARKRAALQPMLDLIQSDVLEADDDSQGPVTVTLPVPPLEPRTTTARFQVITSPRANGHTDSSHSHPLTNGTSGPSGHGGEDVQMSGFDDDTQPMSGPSNMGPPIHWTGARPRPLHDSTRAAAGTQVSQRSALTAVPAGVSPSAILNEASTTGTKTSDSSTNRGGSGNWSTQLTNGQHNSNPDNQPLLDTQSQTGGSGGYSQAASSGGQEWAHSQAAGIEQGLIQPRMGMGMGMGLASFTGGGGALSEETSPTSSQVARKSTNVTSLESILNEDTSNSVGPFPPRNSGSSGVSSQQPVIHEGRIHEFLQTLADRTAGCSVEQLEQIHRELMDEIWKTRHEWNRMLVLSTLTSVFNDTISDIELVQGALQSTLDKEAQAALEEENGAAAADTGATTPEPEAFVYLH